MFNVPGLLQDKLNKDNMQNAADYPEKYFVLRLRNSIFSNALTKEVYGA